MSPPFTGGSKVGLMRVLKNINLLNCILITVSIIFLYGFLFPRLDTDVTFVVPPIIKKQAEKNPFESLKTQTLSPQEYRVIADQNLFHPDRIIPPEKKPESVLPKPEFILFGTLITPDLRMAYLEDKKAPVTTPGRGQRQTALKIGESLSGFILKEVMTDKVIMTRGEETIQVLLQEPGLSKTRETTSGPPGPRTPVPAAGTPVPGSTPGTSFPQTGIPMPTPTPAFPQPSGIAPASPGHRPIPAGRMRGLPSPGISPPMQPNLPGS
jgi:type II secretory pathway component PulC